MNDALRTAADPAAVPDHERGSTAPAWWLGTTGRTLERERLEHEASQTDATAQLRRCFPRWRTALEQLTSQALARLARNEPIDPNDPDTWRSRDAHAQAILHRHGVGATSATRLTSSAIAALIDSQAQADRDAGLDWTKVVVPPVLLDESLKGAHGRLPVALEDPGVWAYSLDQRRALAGRLGYDDRRADDLSRWALAHPDAFEPADLRCWRIGSGSWFALAGEQLEPIGNVDRPVGVFVVPALKASDGWQLTPALSLDMIRLIAELGGRVERDLRTGVVPITARSELLERINVHTLHAGPRECLDSAGQLAQELSRQLQVPVSPGSAA